MQTQYPNSQYIHFPKHDLHRTQALHMMRRGIPLSYYKREVVPFDIVGYTKKTIRDSHAVNITTL